MKNIFNEYLTKAQKMNSSKVINEGYDNEYDQSEQSLKAKIMEHLDQIFDVNDLIQIENFIEEKKSGDSSLSWGSSDGE